VFAFQAFQFTHDYGFSVASLFFLIFAQHLCVGILCLDAFTFIPCLASRVLAMIYLAYFWCILCKTFVPYSFSYQAFLIHPSISLVGLAAMYVALYPVIQFDDWCLSAPDLLAILSWFDMQLS